MSEEKSERQLHKYSRMGENENKIELFNLMVKIFCSTQTYKYLQKTKLVNMVKITDFGYFYFIF